VPAEDFEALTTEFVERHLVQWNAFVRKVGEDKLKDAFGKVVRDIENFAMPALRSLARNEKLWQRWKAGKGWAAP
jgi:hypothetical protein